MKKGIYLLLCLLWVLIISSNAFSEVVRKISNSVLLETSLDSDQVDGSYGVEFIFFQDDIEIARQTRDENGNIIIQEGQILSGLVNEYYDTGELFVEINYFNSSPIGIEKVYDKDGTLLEEKEWENGRLNGITKIYYTNGNVKMEITYQVGVREGISKHYYNSGALAWEYNWKDNGYDDGIMKMYHENGMLSKEIMYVSGKPTNSRKYDENGDFLWERAH